MSLTDRIPSPQATGNAGASYEQHVGAASLSILLTGGMMPFCSDAVLTEVHFQARHIGWHTDDVLLVGEDSQGKRKVAVQAKRTFVLAERNEECVKTFRAAWNDFTDSTHFDVNRDRLALITGQAPTNFSRGMRGLLDAGRAALDLADFTRRLTIDGFVSNDSKNCYRTIAAILRGHAADAVTEDSLWQFFRVWDFALFDFQAPSSAAESLVKSLLAATSNGAATQANDTWNALLHLASEESGRAKSFTWGALPQDLRERHKMPASAERDAFETLRRASQIVRDGVVDHIANAKTLPRPNVVNEGITLLDDANVLLVTAAAGGGKSVIAAKLFDVISDRTLSLAFRADTLATAHLATSALQLGLNIRALVRLFTLHEHKMLWVESGERLFEKDASEREAFADLLRLVTREHGWKVLITCRDYSAEKFRTAFLEPAGLRSAVLNVPALSDSELEEAATALPQLAVPLSEPALREILRNPFYLNLAARMTWSSGTPAKTRRAFREKAWQEVICREDEARNGMPLERDRTMIEIALRRARALVPYVPVEGLPATALHVLKRDSLLVSNPEDPVAQYSPAHDVFEDWALLQWLRRLRERAGGINAAFFAELGTHPALRRAFRLWLLELLDAEPAEGERCVLAVMNDSQLPPHWRDEALVAVFQCAAASRIVLRLTPHLIANDGILLHRAVHLLRVACRKTPEGSDTLMSVESPTLVPDGTAWETIPLVLAIASAFFKTTDIFWLLGFVEDWAEGARKHSNPPGAESVALLCNGLLSSSGYIKYPHEQAYRERVLRVMLSIPRAAQAALKEEIDEALAQPHAWDHRRILELVWSHFSGAALCRELPEFTIRVIQQRLRLDELAKRSEEDRWSESHDRDSNRAFGLSHLSDIEHFPPSAWQGPFLNLLTYHPIQGLQLIVRLINACCSSYAAANHHLIESPFEVTLTLEDGTTHRQWANGRLWCLYRGTSVGPHVMQSALMALEAWLLEKGRRGDADFRAIFSQLLRESNNVAITGVLASVAIAFPYLLEGAAIPLLTCIGFFDADLNRWMQDQVHHAPKLADEWPDGVAENRLLECERAESAKAPHRQYGLEHLAVMLQMASARQQVWDLIDAYRAALPPPSDETDEDRVWRLRLHRVDVRNFVRHSETEDGHAVFQSGPPPADLQAFQQQNLPAHQDRERRTWLFLWGVKVFEGEDPDKFRPEEWKEKLNIARSLPAEDEQQVPMLLHDSGKPQIAAVCLRDHWEEMTETERSWCAETACNEIEALPNLGPLAVGIPGAFAGVNTCAQLVSVLLAKTSDPMLRARARRALAAALLHPEPHISQSAANGIGSYLYPAERPFVLGCVQILVTWSRELAAFRSAQRQIPWQQRRREDDFDNELRTSLAAKLDQDTPFNEAALFEVNFLRYPSLGILLPMLGMFGCAHSDPLSQKLHIHLAKVLAKAWQSDERHRRYPQEEIDDDDAVELQHMQRHHLAEALARFALACPEQTAREIVAPLTAIAQDHAEEAADFVKKIIYREDRHQTGERFWILWQLFADILATPNVGEDADEDDRRDLAKLIDALFLGVSWRTETSEWKTLTGQGSRILEFFRRLPATPRTVRSFASLASRFRSEFIPRALPLVAEKLAALPDRTYLAPGIMRPLESVLEGLVYSGASDVRRTPELRAAAMNLLDMLVDAGSSSAFKVRDDFLTPLQD